MILPFRISGCRDYLYGDAHSIVRYEGERCGFQVVDMVQPLKDYGFQKVSIDGVHFNPSGHRVIARTLFTWLKPVIIKKFKKASW
jgi:lysophospholipase L1-like esterase